MALGTVVKAVDPVGPKAAAEVMTPAANLLTPGMRSG